MIKATMIRILFFLVLIGIVTLVALGLALMGAFVGIGP